MVKTIINAGSQIVNNGIADRSRGATITLSDNVPQFCPLQFGWAKRGPVGVRTFSGSAERIPLYGADTFDASSKYYNHSTAFTEMLGANANALVFERLVPEDIGPAANVVIYLDVLATNLLVNYKRNSDGSIAVDPDTDEPLVDTTTPKISGVKLRFVAISKPLGLETGASTMLPGTMTDGIATSNMYPILEVPARFLGEDYNNSGFVIESIPYKDMDTNLVSKMKSLMYRLLYTRRTDAKSSATFKKNLFGSVYSNFTFNGAIDPSTKKEYTLQNASNTWENETNTRYEIMFNEFEEFYLYNNHIDTILNIIMENEKDYITSIPKVWNNNVAAATSTWFDFLSADDDVALLEERYLCNFLTGYSSKNVRYFTVEFDQTEIGLEVGQKAISFSSKTPIWLENGSDGTLSDANFEKAVGIELDKYLDANSNRMDTAINVETVFIDTGFSMALKEKIAYFYAVRKNTFGFVGTYSDADGRELTNEEEYERFTILSVKLAMFPESDFYGTKACRALIFGGSGFATNILFKRRITQVYHTIYKASAYMGASNGKWVAGLDFSTGKDNIIEVMKDLAPYEIPDNLKVMLWDVQANWSQAKTRKQFFVPALQTVYPYDDSVLNSFFLVFGICHLQTVADRTWREFSGNYRVEREVLRQDIIDFFMGQIEDAFDKSFTVTVEVDFTEEDIQRGYSWTLIINIYGNVARTVQTTAVFAYRAE